MAHELAPPAKLDCPRTREALSPLANGAEYINTRFSPKSATQRLPDLSKANPVGPQSVFCDATVGQKNVLVVKLFCPSTTDAFSPVVNGCWNSRTRPLS